MESDCVFCNEKKELDTLYSTNNFYVKPAAFGTFSPGHVLVLPKFHIRCYGAMPAEYDIEYSEVMEKTREKLTNSFSVLIASELGVYGQSIQHAHTHFFPSKTDYYTIESLISEIPEDMDVEEVKDLDEIRKIFEEEGEYMTIEENSSIYLCHTNGYTGPNTNLRYLFTKTTGLMELQNWKEMPDKFKERNDEWVRETIEVLKE